MQATKRRIVEIFLHFLDLPYPSKYLILEFAGLAKVGRRFSEFIIYC